jgi:hypothetical protein
MVVQQPKFTRVEEPTLLCNQVRSQYFKFPISSVKSSKCRDGLASDNFLEIVALNGRQLKLSSLYHADGREQHQGGGRQAGKCAQQWKMS